jgi:hypothetical protein
MAWCAVSAALGSKLGGLAGRLSSFVSRAHAHAVRLNAGLSERRQRSGGVDGTPRWSKSERGVYA